MTPMYSSNIKDSFLIVLFAGLAYTAFLGNSFLWDWDEAINSATAREMQQSPDWYVPMFNGAPNFNKPIMVTLGIIISFSHLG
ncbi:MAG: ArnT family glycosyltransferase, partial [Thermoguttaceae bacterium]